MSRHKGGQAPSVLAAVDQRVDWWIIEPARVDVLSRLREFWRYRRITWFFATKAVTRMYQGTLLGKFWLFARPLIPITISSLVFGRLLGIPSEGLPYFLFFLAGSASWMVFEQSLLWVTRSLDMNKGLIKKVYFPRLVVPVSSVAPAVVYFGIYVTLLLGTAFYYLVHDGRWYLRLGPELLLAVLACVLSVVFAIAVGLWTSVWQVKARDVRMTLRYVLRFWSYLTPVIYPLSQVPERYRTLMLLNPMAVLVETFKWGTLGVGELYLGSLAGSVVAITLVLMSGVWYFTRAEAASVDQM